MCIKDQILNGKTIRLVKCPISITPALFLNPVETYNYENEYNLLCTVSK
jgi:hypothetical protein